MLLHLGQHDPEAGTPNLKDSGYLRFSGSDFILINSQVSSFDIFFEPNNNLRILNSVLMGHKFINLRSKDLFALSESTILTAAEVSVSGYKEVAPNFFETSKNLVRTDAGIDFLQMVDKYTPSVLIQKNSFFVAARVATLINSSVNSALVHVVADEMTVSGSNVKAWFQIQSEELQTLSYFEDVCGENGGNNFNLGGLALPKEFSRDSDADSLPDEDKDRIKMCKFKSIASESFQSTSGFLDLIKTGSIGTISKQVPESIGTAGVISFVSNSIFVSADSILAAQVTNRFSKPFYGSPSGGSAIFITPNFDFHGRLSGEGVDSTVFYNGAGAGGNVLVFNPLWVQKQTRDEPQKNIKWKVLMSGGKRPDADVKGFKGKYFQAENGMVYSSFCPSGSSSVFCFTCPLGERPPNPRPEERVLPKLGLRALSGPELPPFLH